MDVVCDIPIEGKPVVMSEERLNIEIVRSLIQSRLECFTEMVINSPELEIVGKFEKGEEVPLGDGKQPNTMVAEEESFKILNHRTHTAVLVTIDSIIKTNTSDMHQLIYSLITGVTIKLLGVTRIVGYYSRVANWNASKLGELVDRQAGNYWDGKRVNTEKIGLLV